MSSESRQRGPAAALLLVAFGSGLFLLGQEARAVTYTYEGNNFTVVSGPYDTSMRITGSFELALTLPPNLTMTEIAPSLETFSFSDGVRTLTEANATTCTFRVGTNTVGEIAQWEIFLAEAGVPAGQLRHYIRSVRVVGATDGGAILVPDSADDCSFSGVVRDSSSVDDNPGTWSSSAPVPSLPGGWFAVLACLLIVLALTSLGRPGRQALRAPFPGRR